MVGVIDKEVTHSLVKYLERYIDEYVVVPEGVPYKMMIQEPFNLTSSQAMKIIRQLYNSKQIAVDKETKTFLGLEYFHKCNSINSNSLISAQWVLTDFMPQVQYHYALSQDFEPGLIQFVTAQSDYQIVRVPFGDESYIENVLQAKRTALLARMQHSKFQQIVDEESIAAIESEKYILIVEEPEQVTKLNVKNTATYCQIVDTGKRFPHVVYLRKE